MKKMVIAILLSFFLVVGITSAPTSVFATVGTDGNSVFDNIDYKKAPKIRVILDGQQLVFDVDPTIIEARTLVPMRAIFEALGLTVDWDETKNIAKGTRAGTSISFIIGSSTAIVNDKETIIDVPAKIIDERTMIPLRFLSENMGYNVVWVGDSNLILLSQEDIIEWRYDGFDRTEPYPEYERRYINGEKTTFTRYNGIYVLVELANLHSADGRLVPNVPDFNIAHYGTGWYLKSPYAGKTYWIDIDKINGLTEPNGFVPIDNSLLRTSAYSGNYIKVEIEEHFFDLNIWRNMGAHSNVELSAILDDKSLDGKVINSEDTIFKVIVNDQYNGYVMFNDLLEPLQNPDEGDIYTVLAKEPRATFNWTDDIWQRLKGENPWTGMTADMLLVQKQRITDKSSKLTTRFSVFEIWVYEDDYVDSVYLFDNNVLSSIL